MFASQTSGEAHADGLQDVLEILCQIPREDMCRNLILSVAQRVDRRQAREFEQKARAIHALPYSERWDAGQQLVDRLNEVICSQVESMVERS
jgi:hypothetical protein